MSQEFPLRNLGELSYFLGIQVGLTKDAIHLCQQKYLVNILISYDMINVKPSSTSMVAQQDLLTEEEPIKEVSEYRRLVGSF